MKKALITGAAGNLGKIVCRYFMEQGIGVIALVSESDFLPSNSNNAVYKLDLTSPGQVDATMNQIISDHGIPDFGIFLAGGYTPGNIFTTTYDDISKMMLLNFETCFHVSKHLFSAMASAHVKGRLCFVGARPGISPVHSVDSMAYALSKSMVITWADNMNASGHSQGIRSFTIIPGTMDTPANRSAMPDADFTKWVSPESVAQAIHFGCTNEDLATGTFLMFGDQ